MQPEKDWTLERGDEAEVVILEHEKVATLETLIEHMMKARVILTTGLGSLIDLQPKIIEKNPHAGYLRTVIMMSDANLMKIKNFIEKEHSLPSALPQREDSDWLVDELAWFNQFDWEKLLEKLNKAKKDDKKELSTEEKIRIISDFCKEVK